VTKGRLIVVIAALGVLFFGLGPSVDRAMRSQDLDGITSAAGLHVGPDGRLVVAEYGDAGAPEGRVVLVDPLTDRREVVLDGLWIAWAADMAPDGTVCAVIEGPPPGQPELRCSDGRRVDLSQAETKVDDVVRPRDVLWDGGAGWLVADPSTRSILRVTSDGAVEVVVELETPTGADRRLPVGLARTPDGKLWLALLDAGVTVMPLDGGSSPAPGQYVGGDDVVAVIPRRSGGILLYQRGTTGWVAWCCGGHGERFHILDGLLSPRGLAVLPDGRLAVSANGRVTLYRPDSLPGGEP